jgi:hypothetical protein
MAVLLQTCKCVAVQCMMAHSLTSQTTAAEHTGKSACNSHDGHAPSHLHDHEIVADSICSGHALELPFGCIAWQRLVGQQQCGRRCCSCYRGTAEGIGACHRSNKQPQESGCSAIQLESSHVLKALSWILRDLQLCTRVDIHIVDSAVKCRAVLLSRREHACCAELLLLAPCRLYCSPRTAAGATAATSAHNRQRSVDGSLEYNCSASGITTNHTCPSACWVLLTAADPLLTQTLLLFSRGRSLDRSAGAGGTSSNISTLSVYCIHYSHGLC